MRMLLNRRRALFAGMGAVAAVAGAGAFGRLAVTPAQAAVNDRLNDQVNAYMDELLAFTGGRMPETGRVVLDLPEIAENGNTVPMTVTVDSPMTPEDHVTEVLVLADGNPRPGVARFSFTPLSGIALANTRIRLGETQDVIAVAKTSDGSVFMDRRRVRVTIGGCGG